MEKTQNNLRHWTSTLLCWMKFSEQSEHAGHSSHSFLWTFFLSQNVNVEGTHCHEYLKGVLFAPQQNCQDHKVQNGSFVYNDRSSQDLALRIENPMAKPLDAIPKDHPVPSPPSVGFFGTCTQGFPRNLLPSQDQRIFPKRRRYGK